MEEMGMTNEQSKEFAILQRLDEIDRILSGLKGKTTEEAIEMIEQRKTELRNGLTNH